MSKQRKLLFCIPYGKSECDTKQKIKIKASLLIVDSIKDYCTAVFNRTHHKPIGLLILLQHSGYALQRKNGRSGCSLQEHMMLILSVLKLVIIVNIGLIPEKKVMNLSPEFGAGMRLFDGMVT